MTDQHTDPGVDKTACANCEHPKAKHDIESGECQHPIPTGADDYDECDCPSYEPAHDDVEREATLTVVQQLERLMDSHWYRFTESGMWQRRTYEDVEWTNDYVTRLEAALRRSTGSHTEFCTCTQCKDVRETLDPTARSSASLDELARAAHSVYRKAKVYRDRYKKGGSATHEEGRHLDDALNLLYDKLFRPATDSQGSTG